MPATPRSVNTARPRRFRWRGEEASGRSSVALTGLPPDGRAFGTDGPEGEDGGGGGGNGGGARFGEFVPGGCASGLASDDATPGAGDDVGFGEGRPRRLGGASSGRG